MSYIAERSIEQHLQHHGHLTRVGGRKEGHWNVHS